MKRTFLLSLSITIFCNTLYAQDSYRPLLKEGKTWELLGRAKNFEEVRLTQYVDGDTIVDGEHYYKMYTRMVVVNTGELITVSGPSLMQEDGGQVWELRNDTEGNQTRWLLYDFGLSVGDSFTSMGSNVVRLTAIDNIKVGEQLFRRYTFLPVDEDQATPIYWVEGVGSQHGPMSSVAYGLVGVSYNLRACYEDGACIFTGDDFTAPTYQQDSDDYMPFVQEGKRWIFDAYGEKVSYFIEGDTIIGEHKYKKLWMLKGEERTYQTALREEDRVVYAQHPGEDKEEVICYFTTLGQEKCEFTIQTSDDNFIHFILSEFYPVQASTGRIHHVYESALTYGSYVGGQMMLSNAMWYEGVGNITNAEVFSLTSRFLTENFVECYLDDTCIFKADDVWNFLWDYSDVSSPRFSTKCSKSYFDLQGRSLSCPPEKGVYIRDGRKVVVK